MSHRLPRLAAAALGLAICVGLSVVNGQVGVGTIGDLARLRTQAPGRDLSLNPPRALETTVEPLAQPLAGGYAVLRIRLSPNEKLPPRFNFRSDDRLVTLADDGSVGRPTSTVCS